MDPSNGTFHHCRCIQRHSTCCWHQQASYRLLVIGSLSFTFIILAATVPTPNSLHALPSTQFTPSSKLTDHSHSILLSAAKPPHVLQVKAADAVSAVPRSLIPQLTTAHPVQQDTLTSKFGMMPMAMGGFLFTCIAFAAWLVRGSAQVPKASPEWQLMGIADLFEATTDDDGDDEYLDTVDNSIAIEGDVFEYVGDDGSDELQDAQLVYFEAEAQRMAEEMELMAQGAMQDDEPIPSELLPKIAIVGLPNVGKSELFNRLVGEVKAVVHNTPGVTRDRMYGRGDWAGSEFVIIDTGGLTRLPEEMSYGLSEKGIKDLPAEIEKQAAIAVEQSDVIIFVVDGRKSANTGDAGIAEWLKHRHSSKPIFLAVNKCETSAQVADAVDFWQYGLEPFPISAKHGTGVGDFLDQVVQKLPPPRQPQGFEVSPNADEIRVAIIGRPNVGKSSILNAIVGEERAVVSDVAGTTRDSVDTLVVGPGGQAIRLVDTAGIRKRAKVGARSNKDTFEHISVAAALKAMKKADVVCLVVDASDKVAKQDFRLAELVAQEGRGCVIVVNKWDTVNKDALDRKKIEEKVQASLRPVEWSPVVFTSAVKKRGIAQVLRKAIAVAKEHSRRISTATLNIVVREAFARNMVSAPSGRKGRVYYATQVSASPPTFLIFVNDTRPFMKDKVFRCHMENQLRQAVGFEGTPLRFLWRASRNGPRKSPPPQVESQEVVEV